MTTTYQYDALNRLTQKSYSDGTTPTVTLSYDTSSPYYTNRTGRLGDEPLEVISNAFAVPFTATPTTR